MKFGKLTLPGDFIVLDMEDEGYIPLILRRPFLATGHAIINEEQGEFTLRVDEEKDLLKACLRQDPPNKTNLSHGEKVNDSKEKGGKARRTFK